MTALIKCLTYGTYTFCCYLVYSSISVYMHLGKKALFLTRYTQNKPDKREKKEDASKLVPERLHQGGAGEGGAGALWGESRKGPQNNSLTSLLESGTQNTKVAIIPSR